MEMLARVLIKLAGILYACAGAWLMFHPVRNPEFAAIMVVLGVAIAWKGEELL